MPHGRAGDSAVEELACGEFGGDKVAGRAAGEVGVVGDAEPVE